MISVSADYKLAAKSLTKQIRAYMIDQEVYPTEITGEDDLQQFTIRTETSLLNVVMREAEVKHLGTENFLGRNVNLGFGHVLANDTVEYIDYGTFRVVEREVQKLDDVVRLRAYDLMYDALVDWDLDPIYDLTFPCTVLELLEAICARFDWTLGTTVFPNYDQVIAEDEFTGVAQNYRQVLAMIAEVAGSIIFFDNNDELVVVQVSHDTSAETLSKTVLENLKVETDYGPINSVVLSRQPQEDNIAQVDQSSIDVNGLTEIKIIDNLIVDPDRETYITDIYSELNGLGFYPFETNENGLGYFQPGDRITLQDRTDATYEVIILGIELTVAAGARERLFAANPDKTTTQYKYAGVIGQRIKRAEIIVDKQTGEITIIVSDMNDAIASINLSIDAITSSVNQALELGDVNSDSIADLQEDVTILTQTSESLELAVSGIGGTNLLKNSVGLKGDIKDWQILDENGDPVDPDNDGTIDQSTDVENNSESSSAINLAEQYIEQTFSTIEGEIYTFYCRYKSVLDATVSITGQDDITLSAQADWTVFKIQFTATGPSTTLRISNVGEGGSASITLTDMVCKLGDTSGWIQAPNEVYGRNFRFDKDGFSITSLSDTFKTLLDNTSLTLFDTASGKIIGQFSKDLALMTNLTVQDRIVLQRYENPTSSMRLTPVSDGAILTIND